MKIVFKTWQDIRNDLVNIFAYVSLTTDVLGWSMREIIEIVFVFLFGWILLSILIENYK